MPLRKFDDNEFDSFVRSKFEGAPPVAYDPKAWKKLNAGKKAFKLWYTAPILLVIIILGWLIFPLLFHSATMQKPVITELETSASSHEKMTPGPDISSKSQSFTINEKVNKALPESESHDKTNISSKTQPENISHEGSKPTDKSNRITKYDSQEIDNTHRSQVSPENDDLVINDTPSKKAKSTKVSAECRASTIQSAFCRRLVVG